MSVDHDLYMKQALVEAAAARDAGEVPIGAVVVCGGRVVARAHNLVERLSDPTAHAEMQAITAATHAVGGKYLNDCILYVTVEPCPMCAAAMYWAQLGGVVYGAPDPKRGFTTISNSLLHPKTEVVGGVMQSQCAEMMTDFFKKLRTNA